MPEEVRPEVWWVLPGTALRDLLERAGRGEDPGALMLEEYANGEKMDEGETDG